MPTAEQIQQIQQAIRSVTDQHSFINLLLRETLSWPVELDFGLEIRDIAYEYPEFQDEVLNTEILSAPVLQMPSLEGDTQQPWGIFILEFTSALPFVTGRGLTGPLRRLLRKLVRARSNLPGWDRDNLLFICTHQYRYFRFGHFKPARESGHAEPLIMFGWEPGIPPRTVCQYNLGHLEWPEDPSDTEKWVSLWAQAFDVEKVTRKFYDEYNTIYNLLQEQVIGLTDEDNRKIFVQTIMNRLLFLRFVERKGWLKFDETQGTPQNYLQMLYQAGPVGNTSWYNSRLKSLFFEGMAIPNHQLQETIGEVPYLNGGLFDKIHLDDQVIDIPNEAFRDILGEQGLFYRYNFTVEESTPLDIDVAVDPEMLGKVFEKLVTTRRQKGSYYTPRTVVSFMCREALKGYLGSEYASLVDEHKAGDIPVSQARQLRQKLNKVKVVDPACGSGAYLLGMLHELFDITKELDTRVEPESPHYAYQRKLKIIQNNLYGVDIDKFAINIAHLRLWLSLTVEFEGEEPEPLPNLYFKIETSDSLTAPDPSGGVEPGLHREVCRQYIQLRKDDFMPSGEEERIQRRGEIQEKRESIRSWLHTAGPVEGFDWQVEFLEVFVDGGFDIVIANPPYGGKGEAKVSNEVRNLYFNQRSDSEKGQAKDPYGIFMARGLQLLRPNGTLSYIVSDTWRTIKSHRSLRKRLLETTTVFHVLDLPSWIFDATVDTCIITLKKSTSSHEHGLIAGDLRGLEKGNWKGLSDNLIAVSGHGPDIQTINCARYTYPQNFIPTYDNLSFFMGSPKLYELMNNSVISLNGNNIEFLKLGDEYERINNVKVWKNEGIAQIISGIKTGNNSRYLYRREPRGRGLPLIQNEHIATSEEIQNLTEDERTNGVETDTFLVPFEVGAPSDAQGGLLPNYYQPPTNYYINWTRISVQNMSNESHSDLANGEFRFRRGINYSRTGKYAPTFRLSEGGILESNNCGLFPVNYDIHVLLSILCSRLVRYIAKIYVMHSMQSSVGTLGSIPVVRIENPIANNLRALVEGIVQKQQQDSQYSYHLHEQKEIDALVYQLYGLNEEDIREVELWYCRRYPLLAEAQGVLAEAREKYADHLARCQRILEKPPSYWRSNPVLELIAQGESHTLEFKETLEYSIHTNERTPGLAKSSLKTIAAFLNADGGTLLIGVSDAGEVKGITRDLQFVRGNNRDGFEQKLRSLINDHFDPSPLGDVEIRFEDLQEGTVCQINVEKSSEPVAYDNDFYIRDGNGTRKLEGRALTDWIQRRTQQPSNPDNETD